MADVGEKRGNADETGDGSRKRKKVRAVRPLPARASEPSRPRGFPAAAACDHRRHSRATVPLLPSPPTLQGNYTPKPGQQARREIDAACAKGDADAAFAAFEAAVAAGDPLQPHSCNVLLHLCSGGVTGGTYDAAPETKAAVPPRDAVHPERANAIFNHMVANDIPRTEMTYTALARVEAAMGKPRAAFDLVARLPDERLRPKLRTMAPAMHAFAAAGDIDGAMEVCAALAAANIERGEAEYAALLSAHRAAGRWDDGWNLLREMREEVRTPGRGFGGGDTRVRLGRARVVTGGDRGGERRHGRVCVGVGETRATRRRELIRRRSHRAARGHRQTRAGTRGWGFLRGVLAVVGAKGTAAVSRRRSERRDVQSKFQAERVQLQPGGTRHGEHQDQGEGGAARQAGGEGSAQDESARARGEGGGGEEHGGEDAEAEPGGETPMETPNRLRRATRSSSRRARRTSASGSRWCSSTCVGFAADPRTTRRRVAFSPTGKNGGELFTTPAGSNDDWYWLYAAVASGDDTFLVSNDEMRDHVFQMLPSPRLFQRWKERHQVRFRLSADGLELFYPPVFTTCVQEGGMGLVDVPVR